MGLASTETERFPQRTSSMEKSWSHGVRADAERLSRLASRAGFGIILMPIQQRHLPTFLARLSRPTQIFS